MKQLICTLAMLSFLGAGVARAETSTAEKVEQKTTETAHDVKRGAKKGMHKVEDKMCMKGDVKCLEQKAKHKVEEGSDYVKDKASETKDKVKDSTD